MRFSNPTTRIGLLILWGAWLYTALYIDPVNPAWLGRYASRYFLALIVYSVVTLVVSGWVLLPSLASRFPFEYFKKSVTRTRLLIAALVILGILLWLLLPVPPVALLYPTVVILLTIWLLVSVLPRAGVGQSTALRLGVVVAGVGLLAQVIALLYLPEIHTHDEGAYAHVAMRFLETGALPGDIYAYPPRQFIGFGSWLVTLGYWFEAFGFGWWSGRFYTFVVSLLALVAVYLAGAKFYGRRAGLGAVAFFALSDTFVSLHRIRPDAPMVLIVAAGLWAFARARQHPSALNYALLGFIVTLGLEAHLISLAFWGAYAAVLGLEWLRDCWTKRRLIVNTPLLWFGVGSIAPAALFFVTHLLPDLGKPSGIVVSQQGADLLDFIGREVRRWLDYLTNYPLEALIVGGALGLTLLEARRNSQAPDRLLLRWGGFLLVAYVFVAPTSYPQYTSYFIPLAALFVGARFAGADARVPVLAVAIAALMLAALGGQVIKILPELQEQGVFERARPRIVDYVESHIPPGATVVMDAYYYLYLKDGHEYRYISPGIHPPTINRLGGPPVDEVWASLDPAIIVIDAGKNEHTIWLDEYLEAAGMVYLGDFQDENLEIYVPPDSPLAEG